MKKRILAFALAIVTAGSIFTGCGINKNAALITIDGNTVCTAGEANLAARYTQALYEKLYDGYFGETMWSTDLYGLGTTFEFDIKNAVKNELEEDAILVLQAKDYGVELTAEQKQAIEEAADKFIAANNDKTLKVMTADRDTVIKYLTDRAVSVAVKEAIKAAANITVTKDEAWQRTFTYAFFPISEMVDANGNAQYPTKEFLESQKAAADAVAAAEDFNTAIANLDEKNTKTANYVYTKGETEDPTIDMEVIKAAEALKEGQVSPVVEVAEVGYYVVRLNSEYDEAATNEMIEEMTRDQENEVVEARKKEWKDATKYEFDDKLWSKIEFDSMFKFIGESAQ